MNCDFAKNIAGQTGILRRLRRGLVNLSAVLACGFALWGDEASDGKSSQEKQAVKEALAEFNSLIGGWRGVGQPKRGSQQGAWIEKAEWVWDFRDDRAALRYEIDQGKLLTKALLTYDPERKLYRLGGTFADETERQYAGKLQDKKLVLETEPDDEGFVHRLTLTQLNEKRTLVLHERRQAEQKFYLRVAEVGYTREGTSLAVAGAGERECIVTGGAGTIPVSYQGKTYYVCCTGCKQAFDDDPAGILAEYTERLAEKSKGKP